MVAGHRSNRGEGGFDHREVSQRDARRDVIDEFATAVVTLVQVARGGRPGVTPALTEQVGVEVDI
jgi:hypothetical protein